MNYRNYIATEKSVVVLFDDGMRAIPVENPVYNKIMDALRGHKFDVVAGLVDLASRIKQYTKGKFYVLEGIVYVDAEPLPETLSKRLMAFADADLDYTPLVRFWENLKKNPSKRSQEHLYAFLDQNGIPLTSDGCFVAYKRVNEQYKDCHTGTFDNSVGAVVRMNRADVDDNPEQTCSRGLHVAAYPYAKDFYSNGHLMEVKVSPADVVAVPADYNGQKMRVCEYTVLRECEGMREELLYSDDAYDDTADEDVWDDDLENDIDDVSDEELDDLDDLDDDLDDLDDLDDDLDDDLGEDEEQNEDVYDGDEVSVTTDARGRCGVPKRFVDALGLKSGQSVWAEVDAEENKVYLCKDKTMDDARAYTVDRDGSIRVSGYVLGLAGLDGPDTLYVSYSDGELIITN